MPTFIHVYRTRGLFYEETESYETIKNNYELNTTTSTLYYAFKRKKT